MTDRLTARTGAQMLSQVPVHHFDTATNQVAGMYRLSPGLVEEVVGAWITLIAQEETPND